MHLFFISITWIISVLEYKGGLFNSVVSQALRNAPSIYTTDARLIEQMRTDGIIWTNCNDLERKFAYL